MTMPVNTPLKRFAAFALCLSLTGCGASIPGLSTGSLFGGSTTKTVDAAPQPPPSDPTSRAIQVGTTSARALKCGFNFDPVKLRTQFLASESAALTNADEAAKLSKVYDVGFNGISKAVAGKDEGYCSQVKTTKIKEALNRHLAGDYTPSAPEPAVEDDGGLFGTVGGTSDGGYKDSNPLRRDE